MERPSGGNQQPRGIGCFRGGAPLRASGWVPGAPPVGGGRCRSMWGVFGLQVRGICSQKLVYKKVFGIHL